MKYIVTKTEDGVEEIFIFSESISHNVVAEGVYALRDKTHGNWKRIHREPVSAVTAKYMVEVNH